MNPCILDTDMLMPLWQPSSRTCAQLGTLLLKETNEEEWFLNQLDRVGGRFNFNLEFV